MTRLIFPADILPPFASLSFASLRRPIVRSFLPSFVRLERSILGHEREKRAKMQPCVARHTTECLNNRLGTTSNAKSLFIIRRVPIVNPYGIYPIIMIIKRAWLVVLGVRGSQPVIGELGVSILSCTYRVQHMKRERPTAPARARRYLSSSSSSILVVVRPSGLGVDDGDCICRSH